MEIEVIQNLESYLPIYQITNSEAILVANVKKIDSGNTGESGAGFGNSETNRQVEEAAIIYVTNDYQKKGWIVSSVQSEKCGYDLLCNKNSIEEHVEVKGVQGNLVSFIITNGEVKQSHVDENFCLCAVTLALSNPTLHKFSACEFQDKFSLEPISYYAFLEQTEFLV